MKFFSSIIDLFLLPVEVIFIYLEKRVRRRKSIMYKRANNIHPTVSLGDSVLDMGYITIDEGTYLNKAVITSGGEGQVKIGKYCAIGSNVSIKARTHDLAAPTPIASRRNLQKFSSITIGDHVWIGDNVFIREGVSVGDYVVIGANSVVTSDVPAYAIVGGVPAKIIRFKNPKN